MILSQEKINSWESEREKIMDMDLSRSESVGRINLEIAMERNGILRRWGIGLLARRNWWKVEIEQFHHFLVGHFIVRRFHDFDLMIWIRQRIGRQG